MKNYLFTWLFVILGIASAYAQKNENDTTHYCGTPSLPRSEMEKLPWFGNNQFLYNFLDSLEGNSKNGRIERTFEGYQVAVQAWVYHKDDGSGTTPENWEIMRWLNMANEIYELNNVPIKLYLLCDPVHINRTLYYEGISNDTEFRNMIDESYNPNAFNMHFVYDNNAGWNGLARFPSYFPSPYSFGMKTNRGVISNDREAQKGFVSTLIHEIGHCLGLFHTHQGHAEGGNLNVSNLQASECYQEYVDRNRMQSFSCSSCRNEWGYSNRYSSRSWYGF